MVKGHGVARTAGLRAVLFDVDGTLLDTKNLVYQAYRYAFERAEMDAPSMDELLPYMGSPTPEVLKNVAPDHPAASLTEWYLEFQRAHLDWAMPVDGSRRTLQALRRAGLPIAAISARSKRALHDSLDSSHLGALIDFVVAEEDVTEHKPHPAALLKALTTFGIEAERAVMVVTIADVLAPSGRRLRRDYPGME